MSNIVRDFFAVPRDLLPIVPMGQLFFHSLRYPLRVERSWTIENNRFEGRELNCPLSSAGTCRKLNLLFTMKFAAKTNVGPRESR